VSVGLIALLDDVALIARGAAASLDDVAAQAIKVGTKSAGVLIDDAAMTPRYVVGLSPARELPIVAKIARGSVRNKLLILLPVALALAAFAPWAITPLLMLGGAFLCYEGSEKVYEVFAPHAAHAHEAAAAASAATSTKDSVALENRRVASAIRTDFILSAEIMAIALSAIPDAGFWSSAAILAVVGIGVTAAVYGGVAIIVKADDVGLALSRRRDGLLAGPGRAIGRGLVRGMPGFLTLLASVGTAAMLWVGGGIVLHGLEGYGVGAPMHLIHEAAHWVGVRAPVAPGATEWLVTALGSGLFGLLLGFAIIPVVTWVIAPVARLLRAATGRAGAPS
jgi:predicted DNA repair protein MutK